MNVLLAISYLLVAIFAVIMMSFDGFGGIIFCSFLVAGVIAVISRAEENKEFLIRVFVAALILRLFLAILAFGFDFQFYLASDYVVYDERGFALLEYFQGGVIDEATKYYALDFQGVGGGMYFFVAGIYFFTGRNPLAASFFCGILGAATAPLVYLCAGKIFDNRRVAKISCLFIAFFPAMIIWSSFLLKDGIMVFFLVLTILSVLMLQEKFSLFYFSALMLSLVVIVGLRFYIFPILAVAAIGGFIVGTENSVKAQISRVAVIIVAGFLLTYFGISTIVQTNTTAFGSLERIQASRDDLAQTGDSGYGRELDVSTTEGALLALPVGLAYLMLAPFPWQITSIRAALTLPDTIIWWISIPFLITGMIYAVRYRFRKNIAIIIFSVTLTLFYSIFQGNVGTAYRQRTQVQVFYFMFVAAGLVAFIEKRENLKNAELLKRQKLMTIKRNQASF